MFLGFNNPHYHLTHSLTTNLHQSHDNEIDLHYYAEEENVQHYDDNELNLQIASAISKIHDFFSTKFQEIHNYYPRSETEWKDKALTYLLNKITDVTNPDTANYYDQLVANLKTFINRNLIAPIFQKEREETVEDFIPYHNYSLKDSKQNLAESSDEVINTAPVNFIKTTVNQLLNNYTNFLIGSAVENNQKSKIVGNHHSNLGMSWYQKIPENFKPQIVYDESIDKSSYANLVDALTTTKNKSEILTTAANWNKIADSFSQKLQKQYQEDLKYLKNFEGNNSNFSHLFQDHTINQFNSLIKEINPDYQITDPEHDWNLNLSNADLFSFNNQEFPDLSFIGYRINYSRDKNTNPSFEYVLKKNNAWLSHLANNFAYQGDFEEVVKNLLTNILKIINENFLNFFKIDPAIDLNIPNFVLTKDSFIPTAITDRLFKILPFSFVIDNVQKVNENGEPDDSVSVDDNLFFKIDYQISLGNVGDFQWYQTFTEEYHLILNLPNPINLNLLNQAPELVPIWQEINLADGEGLDIIQMFNDPEFLRKQFSYDNKNNLLEYRTLQAITDNDNINLITQINLVGTNLSRSYAKVFPIQFFWENQQFETAIEAVKTQLIEQFGNEYPKQYEFFMQEENQGLRDQIISATFLQTKSDPHFLTNSLAENIELFKTNFLQHLTGLLVENFNSAQENHIKEHYQNLREKLVNVLNRLGISLESKLAKGLLHQVDTDEAKSHEANEIRPPSPEMTAIIEFLDNPTTNLDHLKDLAPILENINPYSFTNALNTTEKNALYV
ncbi:hypothetical protein J2Z62_000535 [Mycoplasmoides fastidiosum]|uniref:Uncharacterized protein n=2 Tax=Mycoplasmoides fastidiosum TaxID=92758 RepID=A0ABU0LZI3_9BACT|nr:hypothetical protein [Mycoplasmoides fastidiosum]MDQ0514097.1 hypothetical protein [Mycoplasmoides fastidiosum]